ncbi:hypothetical protein F7D13_18140 (plasmid) [Methylocystis rosea]|uniref:Uncharacterized protein n=1 Tax=Methylocystis rosea TaxID=173366 RepID=A0ABX6ENA6_9HYPH|nr:hypothetical protein F7D13_18140 [Methylocystis rosea]
MDGALVPAFGGGHGGFGGGGHGGFGGGGHGFGGGFGDCPASVADVVSAGAMALAESLALAAGAALAANAALVESLVWAAGAVLRARAALVEFPAWALWRAALSHEAPAGEVTAEAGEVTVGPDTLGAAMAGPAMAGAAMVGRVTVGGWAWPGSGSGWRAPIPHIRPWPSRIPTMPRPFTGPHIRSTGGAATAGTAMVAAAGAVTIGDWAWPGLCLA